MTRTRPNIHLRILVPVLLIGASAFALSRSGLAQEAQRLFSTGSAQNAGSPAAPPTSPVLPQSPSTVVPSLGIPATPGQTGAQPNARNDRRLRARRSQSPTGLPVRLPVRSTLKSPALTPDVQPLQTGIPDPATPPPPRLRKRIVEDDPYAPLGIRAGNITLYPALQESVGYDSNPNQIQLGKKGSFVSRTEGELRVQSDWSRHDLSGYLRGAYNEFPDVKSANRPDGSGNLRLRIDATRDTQIEAEGRYLLDTQRPGNPNLGVAVRDRPRIDTYGGSLGVTQSFNRLSVGLRGSVDRNSYEDATLTNGTLLDQSDRNQNQYSVQLRAAYEVSPSFKPFVEGIADTRVYDRRIDDNGFERSSDGLGFRAGAIFEISRLLTGEASIGIQNRKYDDERLKELRGPLVNAALTWSATPLTTLRVRGLTQLDETTIPFSSGTMVSRGTVEIQHDLFRNLSLIASGTYQNSSYKEVGITEDVFSGTLRAEYRLTRTIALRASYTHEHLQSSNRGSSYTSDIVLLGLRLTP